MKHTILVIDDDPVQRRLLEAAIIKIGHDVIKVDSGEAALDLLAKQSKTKISALVLDLMMPEMDGMDVLKSMQEKQINLPVIVQTAKGGIETVVESMRLGAFDFVVKPVSPARLHSAVNNAIRYSGNFKSEKKHTELSATKFSFDNLISKSPEMDKIIRIGKKAADSQIPVLIEGESGVGKELIARAIQGASVRSSKPFITVNCGALPENLVESILFGHEKGAFTGASDKHVGKFEEASGGTLFLDEIGELPLELQVKLLRAIQEGEIDPIGSRRPVKVDIRLISATNRNLLDEIKTGRFREDLYYRLNVLPMMIAPLRRRRDDIAPLIYHFVKKISKEEHRQNISAIQSSAMQTLQAYDWPGNIRELENAIFRAIILCDGEELTLEDFPQIQSQMPGFDLSLHENAQVTKTNANTSSEIDTTVSATDAVEELTESIQLNDLGQDQNGQSHSDEQLPATGVYGMTKLISDEGQIRSLEEIEADTIRFAIEIYSGKMSEVARRLKIGRSTLYRKLKEYEIEPDEQSEKIAS